MIAFEANADWDTDGMVAQRGFIDTLYGVAAPADDLDAPEAEREVVRRDVADYCLAQAAARKPYNFNYLDSATEESFYCSHLVYLAYLRHGIDLNAGLEVFGVPGTSSIVFPQEMWDAIQHRRRAL